MSTSFKAFVSKGETVHVIPKASTDLRSGDYVVMPRNSDPISRARLGSESRISPVDAAWNAQWGIGIVDTDFNTNTVGSGNYASPLAKHALPVIRSGVVRMRIVQTSGKAGDIVIYSSGATGAQLFTLNNFRRDIAVGTIWKDFSGATANDEQQVSLFEKPMDGKDIHFWLGNRIIQGCKVKPNGSLSDKGSTRVMCGATGVSTTGGALGAGQVNLVIVKGKLNSAPRATDFVMGAINPGGQSAVRFYWIAAKFSTTGAGFVYTKETCSGIYSAFASYTNSGISAGMIVPITWNSNMIPVALVVGWSATQYTIGSARILNIDGPGLPFGQKMVDHTTWYL